MAVAKKVEVLKAVLEKYIMDPKYHDILSIVKAARNGAIYGAKVRFPHALVMIFLFRSGSLQEKTKLVLTATKTHARNLATFASIYQTILVLLRHCGPSPGKESPYDSLLAGLIGGYLVFGRASPRTGQVSAVSQQIVIYVAARVLLALAKMSVKPGMGLPVIDREKNAEVLKKYAWSIFASVSWGMVMYLFRWHPEELQGSMRSSMVYIYKQANNWDGLRNFIWHNA